MSITRINEFKSTAGKEDELFEFLKSLKTYIQSSDGCLSCEVLQKDEGTGFFVVIEKWETKESHKQSIESYPQDQMASVMPLLGQPPKGAFYHG
ncbi:putative quinol monooxygenase [Pseudomonas sp. HK3]